MRKTEKNGYTDGVLADGPNVLPVHGLEQLRCGEACRRCAAPMNSIGIHWILHGSNGFDRDPMGSIGMQWIQ